MSVFSKIKHSRKAAKEHKVKSAEKEADKPITVPYKHIPTHAAIDALNGSPSSWKYEDLPKIKEHHKRRSQMAISRTHSMLSTTSYMNAAAGPSTSVPPLPRNISYNSHNSTWFNRDGDLYYSSENTHRKPKQSRHLSYQDSALGPSPLGTEVPSEGISLPYSSSLARLTPSIAVSPVISSGNSTTSNSSDNLDISNSKQNASRPQPVVYAENYFLEQLHTSTHRKLGEAPVYSSPPAVVKPVLDARVQNGNPSKSRWSIMGRKSTVGLAI